MSALDFHLGVELLHRLHELRRGARVQPFFIADLQHAGNGRRVRRIMGGRKLAGRFAHLPVRTRLAMVMYLRPESWAARPLRSADIRLSPWRASPASED